jgi:hypothetical protein
MMIGPSLLEAKQFDILAMLHLPVQLLCLPFAVWI